MLSHSPSVSDSPLPATALRIIIAVMYKFAKSVSLENSCIAGENLEPPWKNLEKKTGLSPLQAASKGQLLLRFYVGTRRPPPPPLPGPAPAPVPALPRI